jgi:VWFA-related protein
LDELKQALGTVISRLRPRDHVAVVTFCEEVRLHIDWTAARNVSPDAVDNLTAGGGTALNDAIYLALSLARPSEGRTVVLVFSDGADTISWLDGERVLDLARRTDAVIYSVERNQQERPLGYRLDFHSGLQAPIPNVAPPALSVSLPAALADDTGGRHFAADELSRLAATFDEVLSEFRTRYVLSYVPSGVLHRGWHPLSVKLIGKRGRVTARRGYVR